MKNPEQLKDAALMLLADEYANAASTAHVERLYGGSSSYTQQCKDDAMEARRALAAEIARALAAPQPEQAEQAEPVGAVEILRALPTYRPVWLQFGVSMHKDVAPNDAGWIRVSDAIEAVQQSLAAAPQPAEPSPVSDLRKEELLQAAFKFGPSINERRGFERGFAAAMRELAVRQYSDEMDAECQEPPFGWRCTREAGHEGPCAAVPAPEDVALHAKGMERLREPQPATETSQCDRCWGKGWNEAWRKVSGHHEGGEMFRIECEVCEGSGTAIGAAKEPTC